MPTTIVHPSLDDVPLTALLRALADPVRLSIVRMAAREDGLPCRAFEEAIPKSTMSHHWRILRESGLIRQESQGVSKVNMLRRREIDERFPGLLAAVLAQADVAAREAEA